MKTKRDKRRTRFAAKRKNDNKLQFQIMHRSCFSERIFQNQFEALFWWPVDESCLFFQDDGIIFRYLEHCGTEIHAQRSGGFSAADESGNAAGYDSDHHAGEWCGEKGAGNHSSGKCHGKCPVMRLGVTIRNMQPGVSEICLRVPRCHCPLLSILMPHVSWAIYLGMRMSLARISFQWAKNHSALHWFDIWPKC